MPDVSILIVEDEPSVAEVASIYLRRAGYTVRHAAKGYAALQEIDRQPPTLIILDLMLPGIDGWEITRRVRQGGDTPIIMLTARSQETDRIAGCERCCGERDRRAAMKRSSAFWQGDRQA